MKKANVNGVSLEYHTQGYGDPLLLITCGPIADGFLPLESEPALTDHYKLVTYHRRGQAGSTHSAPPVSFVDQAADAAALLQELGVRRAHVAGHSTGGLVALQLALEYPDLVHSLILMEPTLMAVPSIDSFLGKVNDALQAYACGDREVAMASFLSTVCGLEWEECRKIIEEYVPGGVAQAMRDVDTFFAIDLPAHNAWQFGADQATRITQPVLSMLSINAEQLFVEGRDMYHAWFPQVEDCTIDGVGHLLQIQRPRPVAEGISEFLARHRITASGTRMAGRAVGTGRGT